MMNSLNTATVSLAVTPTVISTFFSHYLKRSPLHQKPTAHLPYHEGLQLVRAFIDFSSHHTVEDIQGFTAQWVPHPQWVKVVDVTVADEHLDRAAALLQEQLGDEGIRKVGGRQWWRWRKPGSPLKGEWIEMRADYNDRKARREERSKRVIYYVHGGAYYFGSVDQHRYQLQRHARKLRGRVFSPEYRLAPQFPFPCGLHDCLAGYLYLLSVQDPTDIVLAGDSAGGGMVVSLLVTLRDRGLPLPAGAVLISPWVDLTHSFPSVAAESPMDFIPGGGFHHKPSKDWPPLNQDDLAAMRKQVEKIKEKKTSVASVHESSENGKRGEEEKKAAAATTPPTHDIFTVEIDGKSIEVKDQIQMYTTNNMLCHPLVSPVKQVTLGGLPPLLIMVGGGERLRDEQIYLAHKCTNPLKYAPPGESLSDFARAQLERYKPTDVQLQIWDDLCHVAPCLSFTRPAKYMYRSIAQFSAWALARAQMTGIDILDDDAISIISSSGSDTNETKPSKKKGGKEKKSKGGDDEQDDDHAPQMQEPKPDEVGKAGDPLPPFRDHMIRQRVTRHGNILPLDSEADLAGCTVSVADIGVVRDGPVKKWIEAKEKWDRRYAGARVKVRKRLLEEMAAGYLDFGNGESPPPCALASRRKKSPDAFEADKKKTKSMGLSLWSLWGSKHDRMTMVREQKADAADAETKTATVGEGGEEARPFPELEQQQQQEDVTGTPADGRPQSRTRRRTVVDENQTGGENGATPLLLPGATLVEQLVRLRRESEAANMERPEDLQMPSTGVQGQRPTVGGIAVPFRLRNENDGGDAASMVTLQSTMGGAGGDGGGGGGGMVSPVSPMEEMVMVVKESSDHDDDGIEHHGKHPVTEGGLSVPFAVKKEPESASLLTLASGPGSGGASETGIPPPMLPADSKMDADDTASVETEKAGSVDTQKAGGSERPGMETFVTAQEIPTVGRRESN